MTRWAISIVISLLVGILVYVAVMPNVFLAALTVINSCVIVAWVPIRNREQVPFAIGLYAIVFGLSANWLFTSMLHSQDEALAAMILVIGTSFAAMVMVFKFSMRLS